MPSITELLLIELLRKEGLITNEQASVIVSIKELVMLLESVKAIPPIFAGEIRVTFASAQA